MARFSYRSGHKNLMPALQSLARRYGKKKRRVHRLTAAESRSPLPGLLGSAEEGDLLPDA